MLFKPVIEMNHSIIAQVSYGNSSIPASQALPPAGFNEIAFRPACDQLAPVLQADGTTAWTLAMPDGQIKTMAQYPPMETPMAWAWLDADGLCKIGGDQVPIVYTRQLPQQSIIQPAQLVPGDGGGPLVQRQAETVPAPAVEPSSGGGLLTLVGGSMLLIVIAGLVVAMTRRQPKALGDAAPAASTPSPKTAPQGHQKRNAVSDLLGETDEV